MDIRDPVFLSGIHPEGLGETARTYRSQDSMVLDYCSSQNSSATPITKYTQFSPLKRSGTFPTISHVQQKRTWLPPSICTRNLMANKTFLKEVKKTRNNVSCTCITECTMRCNTNKQRATVYVFCSLALLRQLNTYIHMHVTLQLAVVLYFFPGYLRNVCFFVYTYIQDISFVVLPSMAV